MIQMPKKVFDDLCAAHDAFQRALRAAQDWAEPHERPDNPHRFIHQIIKCVSQRCDIPADALIGPRRMEHIVNARHIAIHLSRTILKLNYSEIARVFGHRDHATVIHAVNRIESILTSPDHNLVYLQIQLDHAAVKKLIQQKLNL